MGVGYRREEHMPKPKQDPAMLLFGVAGILAAIILSQIGILPSMAGGGIEGATTAGLLAGGGAGVGLIVWAIYRRFRPWQ